MQARLRAQLGDRSKYSGERRRRSVVVASIVLTITDPLRGSYPLWCYLQAALIRSCGASFACMELTIISRFQRLQASTKSLLHSLFLWFFSALEVSRPYPGMIPMFGRVGRDCGGVLGGVELFGVVLVILLVKNFAISGKVATFVTANEGYASWLKC